MKKLITLVCFVFAVFSAVFAQNDLRFGLQASPGISWMASSQKTKIESNGSNLNFRLGALGEKFFRPNYAVMSGIGFVFNNGGTLRYSEGGNLWPKSDLSSPKFDSLPAGVNLHHRLQYVEIPFGLKMRGGSGEDSYLNFFAEIPMLTLGFNTKALGDIRETSDRNAEDENIKPDVNLLQLSWGLGGGVEYNLSASTAIVAGIQYSQGFLDVTKDGGDKSHNTIRGLTLRLGVIF